MCVVRSVFGGALSKAISVFVLGVFVVGVPFGLEFYFQKKEVSSMGISRRNFLMRVGQVGGYSAAFATMQSLGLMPMKGEQVAPIQAAADSGKGVKVVVLGGGIGGLVSAYELKKLGYDVTLLEARERPGGRNWTGRDGTKVKFVDGTKQTVSWEEGNYQNLGPAPAARADWAALGEWI